MKTKVCIVGPFSPPINGNTKALDTIVDSDICKKLFDFEKIDLYRLYTSKNGKLSLSKIRGFFLLNNRIKKIVNSESVDTYYISNAQTAVGCVRDIVVLRAILKQKKQCKIVLHMHGGGFKKFYKHSNPLIRILVRKYYSRADIAIVLGESLKDMFEGVIPNDRIRVIPNCVDNDMLLSEEEIKEKFYYLKLKKTYTVLYLSNMIESKGYKDLLLAAIECQHNGLKIDFKFAGKFQNEDDRAWFDSIVRENHIAETVEYLGVVQGEQKRKLLRECDIFVLPTYYPNEGQPISIIECMSAGMAVLATKHAGICDLLEDDLNGLFVKPKNPNSIVKAITKVVMEGKLETYCKNSRKIALKNFTEEKYIGQVCDILSNGLL